MIPDVYIQCIDGIPATRNIYDCYIGFKIRGHRIIKFEPRSIDLTESLESNEILKQITKKDILCAGIPVFRKVKEYLGIQSEELETYPTALELFLGRKITKTTLSELKDQFEIGNIGQIFLKPQKQKLFTGFVAKKRTDFLRIVGVDDSTIIYTSDIVNFISEYRVYVNQKNYFADDGIIGCALYHGDALVFPDPKKIKEIVQHFNKNGAPVAYALDVGVCVKHRKYQTLVVEVNDSTCLGNYGIPSTLYAQMIEARWEQITQGV